MIPCLEPRAHQASRRLVWLMAFSFWQPTTIMQAHDAWGDIMLNRNLAQNFSRSGIDSTALNVHQMQTIT